MFFIVILGVALFNSIEFSRKILKNEVLWEFVSGKIKEFIISFHFNFI